MYFCMAVCPPGLRSRSQMWHNKQPDVWGVTRESGSKRVAQYKNTLITRTYNINIRCLLLQAEGPNEDGFKKHFLRGRIETL
jgi:hypothetical protein